jgi:hypothetical protein
MYVSAGEEGVVKKVYSSDIDPRQQHYLRAYDGPGPTSSRSESHGRDSSI